MRESKKRGIIFIVAAAVFALVAAFLVVGYLAELEDREKPTRTVIVARTAIPARARIEQGMLGMTLIPARWASDSLLSSYSWAIDKYAAVDIAAGDFLRAGDVTEGLQFVRDETALTIAVDAVTGVGGNIRAGDVVNVLVSYVNEETDLAKTIVLLQNKRVLAVGSAAQAQLGTLQNIGGGSPAGSATVTLALSLEEASQLAFMSNFAQEVRLTLRQVGSEPTRVAPVTSDQYN